LDSCCSWQRWFTWYLFIEFRNKEEGKPLIFAICRIVFRSLCLICGVGASGSSYWETIGKLPTYHHPLVCKITALFRNTNIKIAFGTDNTIYDILKIRSHNTSTCSQSGVYQLKFHTCDLSCIGQIGRGLDSRFKDHICYITSNNPQQAYSLHILLNAHEYGPMNTTMTLLHPRAKADEWINKKFLHPIFSPTKHVYQGTNTKRKKTLFDLICDIQVNDASAWLPHFPYHAGRLISFRRGQLYSLRHN
jgi:hypothetical protein